MKIISLKLHYGNMLKGKKTFVVTGGVGFIGSHLTKSLLDRGHSVKIIDNLTNPRKIFLQNIKDNDKVDFKEKIDIQEKSKLKKIFSDTDGIFHQAALISATESDQCIEEYERVNVRGTKNIFTLAKELELRVVFASSASVYGNVKKIPIKENQKKNPFHTYGKTKLQCEKMAQDYANEGLKVTGLRYFNVYGEGQSRHYAGVITNFLHQIKNFENIRIFGSGCQRRDFIHVEDVVNANILAMEKNIDFNIMNIGCGKSISILELARMMLRISKLDLKIDFHKHENIGILFSEADIASAKKILRWQSKIKLEDWIRQILR